MGALFTQPNYSDSNTADFAPHARHAPLASNTHNTELHVPAASHVQPNSLLPPNSSSPSGPFRPHSSTPSPQNICRADITGTRFYVPSVQHPILALSSTSTSPESVAKSTLLLDDPSHNSIALFGNSGVGKTTILCALGRDMDIRTKFPDGAWFFDLGHNAPLSSFIRQLQTLVKALIPNFLDYFTELSASDDMHSTMISQVMDQLVTKRFLLLFDNVGNHSEKVYKMVYAMCKAVQGNDCASLKILTSTSNRDIAHALSRNVCIPVNPEVFDSQKSVGIFCYNACIETSDLSLLTRRNQAALDHILQSCEGLPLKLSSAGSAVKKLMNPSTDRYDQYAILKYWEKMNETVIVTTGTENGDGNQGPANVLNSTGHRLDVLSKHEEPSLLQAQNQLESAEAEEVYDVFISHAGVDKWTIAEPLYKHLVELGLRVFLDKAELRPGQNAPEKMSKAMQTAKIAVVILSPEFAARKWTMKELICFLKRFHADGERGVIIIPVFYRLTLQDCQNESSLFRLVNENGESVFVAEGFLERVARDPEFGIADVLWALQSLRSFTGIENNEAVTNMLSMEESEGRRRFVETIVRATVEANSRRERSR